MSATFESLQAGGEDAARWTALRLPLAAWLRLLWNVAPPLLQVADGEPFLASGGLHLPPAPAAHHGFDAARWYNAATAHAAAHIVFSRRVFAREGTAPITQALLGLLEDARVESLACRELPGLRRLWAPLHTATPADGDDFETLMLRLARGLIDPTYDDPHPWVRKGRARFYLDGGGEVLAQALPGALRGLASALGNDIGQMRMGFNARMYRPGPSYRDDNRWLWQDASGEQAGTAQPAPSTATPREGRADATPPAPVCWRYPEWDRLIGRLRTEWCTVRERHAADAATPSTFIGAPDPATVRRLGMLMRRAALRMRAVRRREREGDEIDLDETLRAVLSLRSGGTDHERVHRRIVRAPEHCAVLLLIDCSASSAQPHGAGQDLSTTQLAAQQRVAALMARAAQDAGWSLAIQAFDSDGRHGVNHWRIKDFGDAWDAAAAARLAGLRSGLSTRLGAALRHATRMLAAQPASQRLALVMSDGAPHDVDIHDPHYLVEDARHAVQTARLVGVRCASLLLDDAGGAATRRIFGLGGSAPLQDVAALPLALARLLA
ncbi:MAG: hypothetical protein ABWZ88_00645 [Variovorax sp.]